MAFIRLNISRTKIYVKIMIQIVIQKNILVIAKQASVVVSLFLIKLFYQKQIGLEFVNVCLAVYFKH